MDRFTHAYDKTRKIINSHHWPGSWENILKTECKINCMMEKSHLNFEHGSGADKLRNKFEVFSALKKTTNGDIIAAVNETDLTGVKAWFCAGNGADRVAALKMIKHLYFVHKRGGQDVWVYSPPKSYKKWVYDEISGTKEQMVGKLNLEEEVYSDAEKKLMCDSLLLALNWSQNAVNKLASADNKTKELVRKWFGFSDSSDKVISKHISKLISGFKKIMNVCNSNHLVFSDEPLDRNDGGWKDWAFVYSQEKIDVIYLQNAFLQSANGGQLWKCALTIIHELSHREVKTSDHRYDNSGLKPGRGTLSVKQAIDNADSWAYFATDLAGKLTVAENTKVFK